jgi:hypothetical protein
MDLVTQVGLRTGDNTGKGWKEWNVLCPPLLVLRPPTTPHHLPLQPTGKITSQGCQGEDSILLAPADSLVCFSADQPGCNDETEERSQDSLWM